VTGERARAKNAMSGAPGFRDADAHGFIVAEKLRRLLLFGRAWPGCHTHSRSVRMSGLSPDACTCSEKRPLMTFITTDASPTSGSVIST
jgi:hypothetical protein